MAPRGGLRHADSRTGVNAKLLGTIKAKGGNEVTYNGWPLYTFVSDVKPGVISGEGNDLRRAVVARLAVRERDHEEALDARAIRRRRRSQRGSKR